MAMTKLERQLQTVLRREVDRQFRNAAEGGDLPTADPLLKVLHATAERLLGMPYEDAVDGGLIDGERVQRRTVRYVITMTRKHPDLSEDLLKGASMAALERDRHLFDPNYKPLH